MDHLIKLGGLDALYCFIFDVMKACGLRGCMVISSIEFANPVSLYIFVLYIFLLLIPREPKSRESIWHKPYER